VTSARVSYKCALIDKTPIFSTFDISTTCRYFKVLLFIVDTIGIRREGGWRRFFSLRRPIFFTLYIFRVRIIIRQDLKQWLDNFHLRQGAGAFINRVRRHVLTSWEHFSQTRKPENRAKTARRTAMTPGISNRVYNRWSLRPANTKQMSKFIPRGARYYLAPR